MFIAKGATFRVGFKAFLASDHVTAATGKTIAMTISKNGAAFGNPSTGAVNATSIGNGWYYFDLSATDNDTIGPLCIHGAEGTIDAVGVKYDIMEAHSGLIDVNAQLAGGTAIETSTTIATAVRTEMDSNSADLNTLITNTTGLATAAALTTVGTNVSSVLTAVDTEVAAILAAVDTEVAAIKTKTDFLPSAAAGAAGGVAIVGSAMALSTTERDATATALLNLANGVLTGYTPGRALRVLLDAAAGKVTISGSTVTIRDLLDSINAIVAITTTDGQRTTVTINQT